MRHTIELLLNNSEELSDWYQKAKAHWEQVFSSVDPTDAALIAGRAGREEKWFEQNCGGRFVGREIMVVAGIGQYYSAENGFAENLDKAKAMYNGLKKSMCSVEIRHRADEMATIYPELIKS